MRFYDPMLEMNLRKIKHIQNKTVPYPLRPKFRNKDATNIYFLSKRRLDGRKKKLVIKRLKLISLIVLISVFSFFLSN
tara:strand:+ start:472 stop:705 length:234 start_codon:yes stop_codon:yes gene_type:complete